MLEQSTVFPEAKEKKPRKSPVYVVIPLTEEERQQYKKKMKGKPHSPNLGRDVFQPKPTDLSKVIAPGKINAKMRKAFELCIKYNGDLARAAQESGYRLSNPKSFHSIIHSKSWKLLIEYYFPVVTLFEKGREMLDHPDWRARNAQLERIHRLRGDFTRKVETRINPQGDLGMKTNEELQKIIDGDFDIIDSTAEENDGRTDTVDADGENAADAPDGEAGTGEA